MGKLTEKQTNILYLSIAVFIFLVFGVFSYLDWEKIEETKQQIAAKEQETANAKRKQQKLPKLTADLWKMQQKYDYFKKVLPSKEEFTKFYDTLENFRSERNIKPWKFFRTRDVMGEGAELEKDDKKGKPKQIQVPKKSSGPFEEIFYIASVPLSFDQTGQILNFIENYERFYGVQVIQTGSPMPSKDGGEIECLVNLTLISYFYSGTTPLDDEVSDILKDFEVSSDLQKEIEESKNKEWGRKENYIWTKPMRDPFDKDKLLAPVKSDDTKILGEKDKIQPPPAVDQLETEIQDLQKIRNYLHMLAVAESWVELQNSLIDKKYERILMNLKITKKNDPTGMISSKVAEMIRELKKWKQSIQEADRQKRVRQLVTVGRKKVKEMESIYEEGKKKGLQSEFEKIINIHNEYTPQFREFSDLEKIIPGLDALRKSMENLNAKAQTQIKILQLTEQLKLRGLIYLQHKPELSVAFINEKVVKKNDILMMGFVVHEIQQEGVILRYKEETVPIRLKRTVDKPLGMKRPS